MAHSNPATGTGLRQMDVFREEGVDPARVVIAHTGDTDDLGYIERLLAEGCYIGLDRFGLENIISDERRLATVTALIDRGYANRMMLGQDSVAQADPGPAVGMPNWHITRIFDHTIPYLTAHGVDPAALEAMIGTNVHAWLAGDGHRTVSASRPWVAGHQCR
jgi:phosphotriesterase-related protein